MLRLRGGYCCPRELLARIWRGARTNAAEASFISADVLNATDRIETSKVRYHIANLRRKLGTARSLIETVRPRAIRLNTIESRDLRVQTRH